MKRLPIACCIGILLSISAFAQKTTVDWGGIKLEDNIVIGIAFDIKDASYAGLSYSDRCDVDPELATDWPYSVERSVNAANKYMKDSSQNWQSQKIYFSSKLEGRSYVIVFKVKFVADDGTTTADATLTTPNGTATFTNLVGKGGRFGSFVNLMGDGFESLGKDIAKRIYKARDWQKI